MLFYTILFSLQIFIFACVSELTSEDHEKLLTQVVIEYQNLVGSEIKIDVGHARSHRLSLEVFRMFRHNLNVVLKQLSNFYYSDMPNHDMVLRNISDGIDVHQEVSILRNSLETAVCSFVPRSLDFIGICTNDFSASFHLYQLHFDLCFRRPYMVMRNCTNNEMDKTTYFCDAKNILELYKYVREFPDEYETNQYRVYSESFVLDAFKLVNGIDRKLVIMTLHTNLQNVVFENIGKNVFDLRGKFPLYKPNSKETDLAFSRLNNEFANNMSEDLGELSVPDAVNRLLMRALITLETNFKFKVYNLYNDVTKLSKNHLVKSDNIREIRIALENMFDEVCKQTPLILVYLMDNCSTEHFAETAVPFGLYLTLCSNWMGYLEVHCPRSGNEKDEWTCMVYAILDRLSKNLFTITGNVSNYDGTVPDDRRTYFASDYIESVFKVTTRYYGDRATALPIWTSSDWMTGRHFLTDTSDYSDEMNSLKTHKIPLLGKDDTPNIEVTFEEAYDVLLPWYSDVYNVFAFHEILTNRIVDVMNDFVYRHAKIVVLYLEHVNFSVEVALLRRLSKCVLWYTKVAEKFHDYLGLPGSRKPCQNMVSGVIFAIENLNKLKNKNLVDASAKILQNFPDEKQKEISKWANDKLAGLREISYLMGLEEIAKSNCASAVAYVNRFFFIASKSLGIKKKQVSLLFDCSYTA